MPIMTRSDHSGRPNTRLFVSARRMIAPLADSTGIRSSPPRASTDPALDGLRRESLAPLWAAQVQQGRLSCPRDADSSWPRSELRDAGARYLLQRNSTQRITRVLASAGIRHAIIKGASVRERLYADPALRPTADIDLLIDPPERDHAISVLCAARLELIASPDIISHECTLSAHGVDFDLHWHPMRPGRAAPDFSGRLLDGVVIERGLPLLARETELALLLIHPAITKHVNGREARLVRVIDLDLALRAEGIDWQRLLGLIRDSGLSTAAWATLHWTRALLDTPVPADFRSALAPAPWRQAYLRWWIDHRLTPGSDQHALLMASPLRPRGKLVE